MRRRGLASAFSSMTYFALLGLPLDTRGGVAQRERHRLGDLLHLAAPMPSVVSAGVPMRRPLVYQGPLGSKGSELRLSVMPQSRTRFRPGGR